jgi:hypothetical protein
MGTNHGKQAREELVAAVQAGDLQRLGRDLDKWQTAQGRGTQGRFGTLGWDAWGAEMEALRQIDLNEHMDGQQTLLHLAASRCTVLARVDLLDLLLRTPGVNVNAFNRQGLTALHHVVTRSGMQVQPVVQALLQAGADPLFMDKAGNTSIDAARRSGNAAVVRMLELHTMVWEGWVDFFDVIKWRPVYLVIHRARRVNVQGTICPRCSAPTGNLPTQKCNRCDAAFDSMHAVIYEADAASIGTGLTGLKFKVWDLPLHPGFLQVRRLEESGAEAAKAALARGSFRRALQNVSTTAGKYGLSCKLLGPDQKKVIKDLSFRMGTEEECARLFAICKDPFRSSVLSRTPGMVNTPALPPAPASAALDGNIVLQSLGVRSSLESLASTQERSPPVSSLSSAATTAQTSYGAVSGHQAFQQAPASQPTCTPGPQVPNFQQAHTPSPSAPPAPSAPPTEAPDADEVCPMCMDQRMDTAVLPCGHLCGCHACLLFIQQSATPHCPICRGNVASVVKIYRA